MTADIIHAGAQIVMEFCGGGSVEAAYKGLRGPLTEQEIACIIRESLNGLSFLHSCNKMHRDIKCGNILMTESGQIKIGACVFPKARRRPCSRQIVSNRWLFYQLTLVYQRN